MSFNYNVAGLLVFTIVAVGFAVQSSAVLAAGTGFLLGWYILDIAQSKVDRWIGYAVLALFVPMLVVYTYILAWQEAAFRMLFLAYGISPA